ncbi:MAG: class IV adenylate cyclase [Candidatus Hodarchaeales archaeon]|jgi:adenylate cyclase class 2
MAVIDLPIEFEMKVLVDNSPEWVYTRLKEQNCTHIKDLREVDYYMDTPERSFASKDQAFRARISKDMTNPEIPDRLEITFKGPKIDKISKTREELGFIVKGNDVSGVLNFQRLGFSEVFEICKNRSLWRHPRESLISVDNVDELAPDCYVEAEIISENLTDKEQLIEELTGMLTELLDCNGELRSERRSYLELVLNRSQTVL